MHSINCLIKTHIYADLLAQADRLGPKVGGHPALVLHSSDEPGELSQWQCHDDSTVNIVVAITTTSTIGRPGASCATQHSILHRQLIVCAKQLWGQIYKTS